MPSSSAPPRLALALVVTLGLDGSGLLTGCDSASDDPAIGGVYEGSTLGPEPTHWRVRVPTTTGAVFGYTA